MIVSLLWVGVSLDWTFPSPESGVGAACIGGNVLAFSWTVPFETVAQCGSSPRLLPSFFLSLSFPLSIPVSLILLYLAGELLVWLRLPYTFSTLLVLLCQVGLLKLLILCDRIPITTPTCYL